MTEAEQRAQDEADLMVARSLQRAMRKHSILGSDGTDRITILLLLELLGSVLEKLPTRTELAEIKTLIMATQTEVAGILRDVIVQQKKTITEIRGVQDAVTTLKQKIVELEDQIKNGAVGADLEAAVADLKVQAQAVDDAIPDVPTVPTDPV